MYFRSHYCPTSLSTVAFCYCSSRRHLSLPQQDQNYRPSWTHRGLKPGSKLKNSAMRPILKDQCVAELCPNGTTAKGLLVRSLTKTVQDLPNFCFECAMLITSKQLDFVSHSLTRGIVWGALLDIHSWQVTDPIDEFLIGSHKSKASSQRPNSMKTRSISSLSTSSELFLWICKRIPQKTSTNERPHSLAQAHV